VNPTTKGSYHSRCAARTIVANPGPVPEEATMRRRTDQRSVVPAGVLAAVAVVAVVALALAAWGVGAGDADEPAPRGTPTPTPAVAVALAAGSLDFERCARNGWMALSEGSGTWYVYSDGTVPPDPSDSDPRYPFRAPPPPQGRFAAVTDMSAPGSRILYRDATPGRRTELRFTLFYDNHAVGAFHAPNSLDHEGDAPNQQVRVDLLDPSAPADSVAAQDVLATIVRTRPGDPAKVAPRRVSFDLSRWAGRKVRIRFAQVDNLGPLRAGVDDVRLTTLPSGSR
jgi:hypothetical protein